MNHFQIVTTFVFMGVLVYGVAGVRLGGISDEEEPISSDLAAALSRIEPEVIGEVRKTLKGNAGTGHVTLEPVSYKSQVVAGMNYFVKYRLNKSNVYYHARIYSDLQNNLTLVRITGPNTEADPIMYF